jgi:gas vesicle protein
MRHDEQDELLEIEVEQRGGLGTFVLGMLVGAGAALLLAPRGGRETQREIARALRERASGPVDGARESVTGWVGQVRGRVTGRLDEVREAVDERVGRVRGAVEEGRVAARQARVELRRRVDEAKHTYRSGRAGTPPVPLSAAPSLAGNGGAPRGGEVVITGVATERDPGDLAG